jgi:hypothetical protein
MTMMVMRFPGIFSTLLFGDSRVVSVAVYLWYCPAP